MLTAEKMRNILYHLGNEKQKEACFAEALGAIVTGHVEVELTESTFSILKILLPAEIYELLDYYILESRKNGQIVKEDKVYKLTNDDEFVDYLIEAGLISN